MLQKIILGGCDHGESKTSPNSVRKPDSEESDDNELGKGGTYEQRLMRRKTR